MQLICRHALGRAVRVLLLCGVLSLGASGLWAQGTTGKVQGTVLDPTGQPIANAQVFVLGTTFAAFTNEDGFYFINNVPAGVYSMRAQFIGYQPAQMEGIRILADQTLTADFRLSGAVALEAITITAAEQPIVPRDQVASKAIVTGEEVDRLPVNDGYDVVQLQPGVITGRGGQILIRGSRADEAVIFIDGSPVRRMDTNDSWMDVGSNMLAEVSVTTGAMAAQYGDAQSGVISFVTGQGGPRFVASFAYEGDEMLGTTLGTGYNRFEAALSGPVIGNLTFAVGGTLVGNRTAIVNKGGEDVASYTFFGVDTVVTNNAGGPLQSREAL
ncbi:MAG: carboxypeptidase regulatory-like domain-containing protein, partial [Gemmatimonadales bacterium]